MDPLDNRNSPVFHFATLPAAEDFACRPFRGSFSPAKQCGCTWLPLRAVRAATLRDFFPIQASAEMFRNYQLGSSALNSPGRARLWNGPAHFTRPLSRGAQPCYLASYPRAEWMRSLALSPQEVGLNRRFGGLASCVGPDLSLRPVACPSTASTMCWTGAACCFGPQQSNVPFVVDRSRCGAPASVWSCAPVFVARLI